MPRDHELDLTVLSGGEVSVKVHYRDRVPDYLSGFSEAVQRRAKRLFWIKSPFERLLWKATRTMPWWARLTVRQHLLRDRATRIQMGIEAREAARHRRRVRMEAHQKVVRSVLARSAAIATPLARAVTAMARDRIAAVAGRAGDQPGPSGAREEPVAMPSIEADRVAEARLVVATPSRPVRRVSRRSQSRREPAVGSLRHGAGTAWSGPMPPQRPSFLDRLDQLQPAPKAAPWAVADRSRGR